MTEKADIIIDNGSGYIKAGFSDEDRPKSVFPTVLGTPKSGGSVLYYGSTAIEKCNDLRLKYPIRDGIIENWEGMEKIWEHCFTNELKCAPSEHRIIVTDSPKSPIENREKMAQILFEKFNVKGLYITFPPILSLFAAGKFTGMACDCGDALSDFVPIYDGFRMPVGVIRSTVAGRDVTESFIQFCIEKVHAFTTIPEKEIARDIKEKLCYVPLDFSEEMIKCNQSIVPTPYELPDGNVISLKEQLFRSTEVLFQPSFIGKEVEGFSKNTYNSIQKCDLSIRKDLYESIIICGGSSMFRGFKERLTMDVKNLAPEGMKKYVKVDAPTEGKISSWIGGKTLANISTFGSTIVTKDQYSESGAQIIQRYFA